MSPHPFASMAAQARAWLFEDLLPYWTERGFERATGFFVETLDDVGQASVASHRVRVQARQTYVFIEAGRMGWAGPWRELAEAGLKALLGPTRAAGGAAAHSFDRRGVLVDARRDLYDQAFVLFALGHARRLDPAAVDARIGEMFAYLATQRSPAGGYLEGEISSTPRRQNPHMHLFEAGLALQAGGVQRGAELVAEVADLFARRFFDPQAGAVREYYAADWTPLPEAAGMITEPGHHCEWAWLLHRARLAGGPDLLAQADQIWAHAMNHGRRHDVLVDEVLTDGSARTLTMRLWPQTERLKAALARWERGASEPEGLEVREAFEGLMSFIAPAPRGLWRERRHAEGDFKLEPSPASSIYHLTCAIAELVRVGASEPAAAL